MRLFIAMVVVLLFASSAFAGTIRDIYHSTCRVSRPEKKNKDGSVRIQQGVGTGVVYSEDDTYYWVLTAGHVAREKGFVWVEFFYTGHKSHYIPAKCTHILYGGDSNVEDDVALVRFLKNDLKNYPRPKIAKLAPANTRLRRNQQVVSAGCAKSQWPTAWIGHVDYSNIDTFYFDPDPLGGRSGSAIFDADCEQVVGIIVRKSGLAISVRKIRQDIASFRNGEE